MSTNLQKVQFCPIDEKKVEFVKLQEAPNIDEKSRHRQIVGKS